MGLMGLMGNRKRNFRVLRRTIPESRTFGNGGGLPEVGEVLAEFSEFVLVDAVRLEQGLLFGREAVTSLQEDVDNG